ncbi:MAG TPA: ELWxxDGT repeat protein [Candidatus Acidoferrum sp.]|nr:ELWxxDGT repeat protein [Candidatus Acidoferrum sp.]
MKTRNWLAGSGRRAGVVLLAALTLLPAEAVVFTSQLVTNLPASPGGLPCGSSPSLGAAMGGYFYFAASDGTNGTTGRELWRTDGTAGGTTLVKDINPGDGDSSPQNIIAAGTNVLFLATDGVHGQQLWRSDGTAAGTFPITSFDTNASIVALRTVGSGACYLVQFGGFFSYTNILYRTDGTIANTFALTGPGAFLSTDYSFGTLDVSGSTILYGTLDGVGNSPGQVTNSLWSFSGNGPYTLFHVTTQPTQITFAGIVGANCYFVAGSTNYSTYGGTTPPEGVHFCYITNYYSQQFLWRISLFGGPPQVADASPLVTAQGYFGPTCTNFFGFPFYDSELSDFRVINNHLFYSSFFTPPSVPPAQYTYGPLMAIGESGAPATIVPGNANAQRYEQFIGVIGANIYYWDFRNPNTIFQTDGASAGVAALNLGALGFHPSEFLQVNSQFFFVNSTFPSYSWAVTDLTPAGTYRLMTSSVSNYSLFEPIFLGTLGNLAFFHALDVVTGDEPYRSDGTTNGTFLLKDIAPGTNVPPPMAGLASGGLFYFPLATSDAGLELWRSDGTAAGTFLLKDINPGTNTSSPSQLTACNGIVFFSADDGSHGPELWRSDGTAAGTYMVKDIRPGAAGSNPTNLVTTGTNVFFVADDGSHGPELWVSDGTSNGTYLVQDIVPGIGSGNIHELGASGGEVHFVAGPTNTSGQFWFSTSQPGAAQFLYDFGPSPDLRNYTAFAGKTYFAVFQFDFRNDRNVPSLWVTDDTPAGTTVIANNTGSEIRTANGLLFTTYGTNLFTSDGTTQGTVVLTNQPGGFSQLTPLGTNMYFTSGSTLWSSDGTANNTFPVAQFSDPTQPLANLTPFEGTLIFSAGCPTLGRELWATAPGQGATLIEDLSPLSGSDNLQLISAASNQVFYIAKPAGQSAWQLRTLHLQSLSNPPAGPFGGTPWPVPGLIEAENFDLGGEGVAYHDTTADNEGGVYRPLEGVDIEACDDTNGGFCVFQTRPGEWMNYTVNAAYTGLYQVEVRTTTAVQNTGTYYLAVDGVQMDIENVINNGTPGSWASIVDTIPFSAGTHVFSIMFFTPTTAGDVGAYNWFKFTALATNQPPTVFISFPPAGGIVSTDQPVALQAQVIDPTAFFAPTVEFFVDGQSLGVASNPPYAMPWTPTPGIHTASAIATDSFGVSGASSNLLFFVTEPLFPDGSFWRANPFGTNLPNTWRTTGYDDSKWPRLRAPFGFGYQDLRTLTPSNFNGSPIPTFYFRTTFSNNLSTFNLASITLTRDDAAVVWINGQLLKRINLPQPPTNVVFTNLALTNVVNNATHTNAAVDLLLVPTSMLLDGTNLIAVEIHQGRPDPRENFDMKFDLSFTTFFYVPPTLLSISATNSGLMLQWPDTMTNWTAEHSTDLNSWSPVTGATTDTNGFFNLLVTPTSNPRDFFRLHQTNGP